MAKKFRFDKVFYFRPADKPRVTMKYDPSSKPQTVTDECAAQAVEAGVGELIESKGKGKSDASGDA